jgi:hypothetical protein
MLCVVGPLAAQDTKPAAKPAAQEMKPAASPAMLAKDKATKSSGAADSNIKKNEVQNDPANATMIAPNKSAAKSRGAGPYACAVHVDNRVAIYINIYVDGDLVGVVGPGGDLYIRTGNGATSAYGRAIFEDGSSLVWGPRAFDCEGSFTWQIVP